MSIKFLSKILTIYLFFQFCSQDIRTAAGISNTDIQASYYTVRSARTQTCSSRSISCNLFLCDTSTMLSDTMLSTVTGKSAGETWKTIILKTSPHPESYLERYKIDDLQHITIPWLPKLGTNRNMDLKEVGFIQTIYYYCDVKFTLANLLARAFSIILKKEYHANCLELFPFWNIIDQSHVLRSMWFC